MPLAGRAFAILWLLWQTQKVADFTASRDTWQERASAIRQGILIGAQLDPLPEKTPLNPVITHTRKRNGYSVSDVAFESAPGFFVFGNLYTPQTLIGRAPAVLVPHGHFKSADWYARTRPENQILCGRLAQLGAVVFTYDMVGWGDSRQIFHNVPNALQLQLWDSIRAVDFLTALPIVDSQRIGVTGASGGATQAIYLAAVDSRIAASMPVVMVSSRYTGHERCEDGMPVHKIAGEENANNVEIAAAIAPKPIMFVSDGSDWTKHFPDEDFPQVKRIYSLYPSPTPPGNVHFPRGKHDYGPEKRAVCYRFFAKVLGMKSRVPISASDAVLADSKGSPDFDPNPECIALESQHDQTVLPWISLPAASEIIPEAAVAGVLRAPCVDCSASREPVQSDTGQSVSALPWYFDK